MANMNTTHSIIDRQFTRQLNAVVTLFNADLFDLCEQLAKQLVVDSAVPRYHRIRLSIILASIVEDDVEAKLYQLRAKALWRRVRRASRVGDNADLDKHLDDIREELDELKGTLGLDWYLKVEEDQAVADKEVRTATAGDHDDPMGPEEDEASALGAVTDMRIVDLD